MRKENELYLKAKYEANRCLYCYDPPCNHNCPSEIDVVGFIQRIKTGDVIGSLTLLRSKNIFSHVCSFVCPAEYLCETDCPRKKIDKPVNIKVIQEFVSSQLSELERAEVSRNQYRVGIVGGGPAGLSCAHRLVELGYRVTLFEKRSELGGLISYGIPNYRLPLGVFTEELNYNLKDKNSLNIVLDYEVGKDISAEALLKEYDAIFLSMGRDKGKELNIPGIEFEGVFNALDILKIGIDNFDHAALGQETVVIGGGNVAMDVACLLRKRKGSIVRVVYRRSREEIPAWRSELNKALELGVDIMCEITPIEVMGKNSRAVAVNCIKTRSDGKRGEMEYLEETQRIKADSVVVAIGQELDCSVIKQFPDVKMNEGFVAIEEGSGQTDNPKIFGGGDLVRNSGTVVQAVFHGRRSAEAIDRFLSRQHR